MITKATVMAIPAKTNHGASKMTFPNTAGIMIAATFQQHPFKHPR